MHSVTIDQLAARSQFQDGRGSNPHSTVKNNLQLYDKDAADGMARALYAQEDFRYVIALRSGIVAPALQASRLFARRLFFWCSVFPRSAQKNRTPMIAKYHS